MCDSNRFRKSRCVSLNRSIDQCQAKSETTLLLAARRVAGRRADGWLAAFKRESGLCVLNKA